MEKIPWVDRVNLFFHYRRYIKMLARRWPVLLIACVCGASFMAWKAYKSPDIFVAYSKIGVAPKLTRPHTAGVIVAEELNYFYENQMALLGGKDVRGRVDFELKKSGAPAYPAVLETSAGRDKGNLLLTVRSTDFEFARVYSKLWAQAFVEFKNQQRVNLIDRSAKKITDEIIENEQKLTKVKQQLIDFERKHRIASIKEKGDSLQKRYDEMLAEYQTITTLVQRLKNKTKEDLADGGLADALPATSKSDTDARPSLPIGDRVDPLAKYLEDSGYAKFKRQLREKQSQREQLVATLKPSHPFMKQLDQDLARLQTDLQWELDMIEEKRLARIRSLDSDAESYKPMIEELKNELYESRGIQEEYSKLKEEEQSVKDLIVRLKRDMQDYEATSPDESQFDVLEEGIGSPVPVEPNRRKMVLTGLLAGFLAGLALLYFLDKLDDRLELAEEIEAALQEPVLGQVPEVPDRRDGTDSLVLTKLDDHSMFSEAIRGVRSAVLLGFASAKHKILVITSAVPGDGKTTFTTNFAITLAVAGHRVLLVDADLRRGNTHTFFGNQRDPGFTDILQGEQHWTDVMRSTQFDTLKVIHSGKIPSNPGELLISPIPGQLVEEARGEFDFIIFDCPPITAIDDTFSLLPFADGVLFVVRSGKTSIRFARNGLHAIKQRGAEVLGLILNGITPDNPYYYYQQYYHKYYTRDATQASPQGASMPVKKMAAPRKVRLAGSIEQAAREFGSSDVQVVDEAARRAKAEEYKARRAAKAGGKTLPTDKET